ncbi:HPr family phosphocarrier protein [Bifidobacterium longum subsp. suis]|uniref:HPr family phosphocarrier protein n=1 Tax=Bifidobacterium longum TaxID=216816 RepID=UPI001928F72E|nr:HPr family phosphocarrier protein [Bifidobacterium longum subsp. suis]
MSQIFAFTVSDPEGMHARPAGRLVAKAREYESLPAVENGPRDRQGLSELAHRDSGAHDGPARHNRYRRRL